MTDPALRRPPIPRDLHEPNAAWVTLFVLDALVLFLGLGWLAGAVASSALPLEVRLVAVPLLLLGASHGAHLLGWIGHEGIHLTLHRDKYVSVLLGTFLSAMTPFSAIGYGVSHWNHHRFTNQDSDPDAHIYPRFRGFWSRFLLARTAGNRTHLQNLVAMTLGRPLALGYKLPFSAHEQRLLARANLGFLVFWLLVYAAVAVFRPATVLFAVVLPVLLLVPISGLRGYVEHGGTTIGTFRDTRSYVAPLYTWLFFGNNFHLEHHLYPGVPCYRLPAVHRLLRDGGYLARWGALIDPTVLGPLRHTTRATQYPEPLGPDLADDPFRPAADVRSPAPRARHEAWLSANVSPAQPAGCPSAPSAA